MKIVGIGVDIIENKRIKNSLRNLKFKKRVFSNKELAQSSLSKNKVGFFSKRFAAKEAFAKALGTGFRGNLNFKDIEIFEKTKKIKLVSIGPQTTLTCKSIFKRVDAEANPHDLIGLGEACQTFF